MVADVKGGDIEIKSENEDVVGSDTPTQQSIAKQESAKQYNSISLRNIIDCIRTTNEGLSIPQCIFILTSMSFGSAVVILPYTVSQMGPIQWVVLASVIILTVGYCTKLTKDSCAYLINTLKFTEKTGDIYPEIAGAAFGSKFQKAVTVVLFINNYTISIACSLLAASVFQDTVVLPYLSPSDQIRCWTVICIIISLPIMFLENFDNLKSSALIAVMASSLSMACVLVDSIIVEFNARPHIQYAKTNKSSGRSIFASFGSITFGCAGASSILPSMFAFVKTPEKLSVAILWTFSLTFLINMAAGLIPYFVFGHECRPSITTTLHIYFNSKQSHPIFQVLLLIAQLSLAIHVMLVAVLALQPIFQNLERHLKVPKEFTWKRLLLRSCVAFSLIAACLAVPNFSPVLSLVGGVPLTLICMVFPIIIYMKLFELNVYTKVSFVAILCTITVLVVGNFVVGLMNIAESYKSED